MFRLDVRQPTIAVIRRTWLKDRECWPGQQDTAQLLISCFEVEAPKDSNENGRAPRQDFG
jgi:hypothetical protein